jgi:hypothetical protein
VPRSGMIFDSDGMVLAIEDCPTPPHPWRVKESETYPGSYLLFALFTPCILKPFFLFFLISCVYVFRTVVFQQ